VTNTEDIVLLLTSAFVEGFIPATVDVVVGVAMDVADANADAIVTWDELMAVWAGIEAGAVAALPGLEGGGEEDGGAPALRRALALAHAHVHARVIEQSQGRRSATPRVLRGSRRSA
jgi:hypothetical protein